MLEIMLAASLVALLPARSPAHAADIVVSAQWLKAHLNDADLVVLDLTVTNKNTSPDSYGAGHIPGSRPLPFRSIFTGDGTNGSLSMQLVPPDSLRQVLEGLGVSDRSTIVLYSTAKRLSAVARAYVTLDYLGLGARTRVLDGGYEAWSAAGGAVETAEPNFNRGVLHTTPRLGAVTDGEYVKAHLVDRNLTIVDARAPEFYSGAVLGYSAARTGHIPGAHNVYYLTLADSTTNTYLTPATARAKLVAAGIPLDKPAVVYCHIGQTASVDYVQLRRLGVPVRLYDGSFEDWSRHADYPVATGTAPQ